MSTFDKLAAEMDLLQKRAVSLGRGLIKAELDELNKRFHRHKFSFHQGMGREFVNVTPWIFREHSLDGDTLNGKGGEPAQRFQPVIDLMEAVSRIIDLAAIFEDTFNVQLGDVG